MKAWQGAVGIAPTRGIVSGHYVCFEPHHDQDPEFLDWLLRSAFYTAEYARISRGVRPGQQEIDNASLRSLPIRLPPLGVQLRISAYLRVHAARTDALVAEQRRLLAALAEREEREGGLPEFFAFPSNRVRLSHVARKLRRRAVPGAPVVTAFRDGTVTSRELRRPEGYTESAEYVGYQGVRAGDVVVHGLDGFAGAIGVAETDGNCSAVCHVVEAGARYDQGFLALALRSLATSGLLATRAASTRQRSVDFRSWSDLGSLELPDIPLKAQAQRYAAVSRARMIRLESLRLVDSLNERMRSLVNSTVLGQAAVDG
jgi:type I restriction enzyme S subunit